MAIEVTFKVNGATRTVTSEPERTLLEVLREDLGLTGTKCGCGEGTCRSCTVIVDGRPKQACQIAMDKVEGTSLETIESLAQGDKLHPVQEAFISECAMQCGFCVPGMVLTAVALLRTNAHPTREQIVEWMNGNLCRCCNYEYLINAVQTASKGPVEAGVS